MGADGKESGIEAAGLHRLADVRHLGIESQHDAEIEDALHFGIEHLARQAVLRNAETHHAAGVGTGFVNLDGMAQARQLIGSGKP